MGGEREKGERREKEMGGGGGRQKEMGGEKRDARRKTFY